jgi:hypothetical protein
MSPGICQELKKMVMVFITLIKNNINYTYSLQFLTCLSNSFHLFLQFFPILFNSFHLFLKFFPILFNYSFQFFTFFLTIPSNSFQYFHFFLKFFPILFNYFQFFQFFLYRLVSQFCCWYPVNLISYIDLVVDIVVKPKGIFWWCSPKNPQKDSNFRVIAKGLKKEGYGDSRYSRLL